MPATDGFYLNPPHDSRCVPSTPGGAWCALRANLRRVTMRKLASTLPARAGLRPCCAIGRLCQRHTRAVRAKSPYGRLSLETSGTQGTATFDVMKSWIAYL